mgnify:FL=1
MSIDELAELNKQFNEIKKKLDKAKAEYKEQGEGRYEGSSYSLVVEKRVSQKLNEEKATEVIKELGAKWLLKEVVDTDKLEDSIAVGEVDGSKFADCIDTKETLAVKFVKGKKKDA